MPKQTYLIILLSFALIVIPDTVPAARSIQTAQQIIVIDPGHGGSHSGLVSPMGLKEKNLTLKLAKKTARELETHYNVVLTRTSDINVSPEERISIANQKNAALFISLHLNHSNTPAAFIYYFDTSGAQNITTGRSETTWLSSALLQRKQSLQAAKKFTGVFSGHNPPIKSQIKGLPTIILEGSTMPALLIEPLSLSTLPTDAVTLETVLDMYAQMIKTSIDAYFERQ